MLAETINQLEGNPTNALPYFAEVRARAFSDSPSGNPRYDLVEAKHPGFQTNKDAFFKALVDERAFEFCGENIRKWDLMRWGMLKEKMDEAKENLKMLRYSGTGEGASGPYATVPSKVFWKWNADNETITIYGMNRDEHDTSDKNSANGWNSKSWTIATDSQSGDYLLDTNKYIEKVLYQANPDENQLLPIHKIVISNSQGYISNTPLTGWTSYN
jgi:hypothetical protein